MVEEEKVDKFIRNKTTKVATWVSVGDGCGGMPKQ